MALGLEDDEEGAGEPVPAPQTPVEVPAPQTPDAACGSSGGEGADAEERDWEVEAEPDDFSAWVAETEDVAVAAGDVPESKSADIRNSEKEAPPQSSGADEALEAAQDGHAEAEDAPLLAPLLAIAPQESATEQMVARSLLLRLRSPPGASIAADPAASCAEALAAEDEGAEAGDDDEAAIGATGAAEAEGRAEVGAELDMEASDEPAEPEAAAAEESAIEIGEEKGFEALDLDEPAKPDAAAAEESAIEMGEEEGFEATEAGAELDLEALDEPAKPEAAAAEESAIEIGEEEGFEATEVADEALLEAKEVVDAEVWDVDELDAQAEAFGAHEATAAAERAARKRKEDSAADVAAPAKKAARIAGVAGNGAADEAPPGGVTQATAHDLEVGSNDDGPPGLEATDGRTADARDGRGLLGEIGALLDDVQGRLARAEVAKPSLTPGGGGGSAAAAAPPPRSAAGGRSLPAKPKQRPRQDSGPAPADAAADPEGRRFDLQRVVVNFVEVGRAYARTVLDRGEDEADAFDWEGVRNCVQHLASEHGLQVLGVIPKNFEGDDSWSNGRCGLPDDVTDFCESVEEASSPSCSGCTVTHAYRKNCRFVDSEDHSAYRDSGLCDAKCQAWIDRCQDWLQIRYSFDPGLGSFSAQGGTLARDRQ